MNIAKMMKQAQKMQADMQKMQQELAAKTFEASAGGGAVKATTNGSGDVLSLVISPDLFKEGDVEMVQDLVLTAIRESLDKGRKEMQAQMGKMTSGLNIPGLGGLGL